MITQYRVLVCGGRNYDDKDHVFETLDSLKDTIDVPLHIISGAAKGADSLASEWARLNHVDLTEFPADWSSHGKSAGPIRNQQMLGEGKPDLVVAFPGGRGTQHMVNIARKAGVSIIQATKSDMEILWKD